MPAGCPDTTFAGKSQATVDDVLGGVHVKEFGDELLEDKADLHDPQASNPLSAVTASLAWSGDWGNASGFMAAAIHSRAVRDSERRIICKRSYFTTNKSPAKPRRISCLVCLILN